MMKKFAAQISALFAATAFVSAMSGCATSAVPTTSDTEAFASQMIAEKVAVAAQAQREYVALVNEDKKTVSIKQSSIDYDLVDIDYLGKPQELLQTFAYKYGYRYIESGKRAELKTVNVQMKRVRPVEILRNVGYQVDSGADVTLDKNEKTIRLVYKNIAINSAS